MKTTFGKTFEPTKRPKKGWKIEQTDIFVMAKRLKLNGRRTKYRLNISPKLNVN